MSLFRFGKSGAPLSPSSPSDPPVSPRPNKSGFMAFISAATQSNAASPKPPSKDLDEGMVLVSGVCKSQNLGFGTAPSKDGKGIQVATLAMEGVVFDWNMDERHSSHVHVGDLLLAIGHQSDKLEEINKLEYTKAVDVVKKYSKPMQTIHLQFQSNSSSSSSEGSAKAKSKMAVSGMSILRAARGLVSKKKIRFQKDGFDLDLAYITPQLIAMGFPSEGTEGIYRNPMSEVKEFFQAYHPRQFKVYNLCLERKYPWSRFEELGGQVAEFGFEDHNPPPFNLLLPLCEDVQKFLSQGDKYVVSLHCKAGKGRTGTAICTYLVYSEQCTAAGSLSLFGDKRTKNSKGVTIPSQRRYIYYFEQFMQEQGPERPLKPLEREVPMKLTHLVIHTVPKFADGGCTPFVQIYGPSPESQLLYDYREQTQGKMPGFYKKGIQHITMPLMVILQGDVKLQFKDAGKSGKDKTKMFHLWLNTYFVKFTNNTVFLEKSEVDKAFKDKHHKKFDKKFAVELFFETPSQQELDELSGASGSNDEKSQIVSSSTNPMFDEDHMPSGSELDVMFDKYLVRSKFSETGIARMKKLTPEAKWTLILQDRAVGGVRASLAIPKANYTGKNRLKVVQEKSSQHMSSIMVDPDEEDNEEEDNDDDDTWAEAFHGFYMVDDDQYNYVQFKAGDLIRVTKQEGEWWYGHCNGSQGYFPSSHVTLCVKH